jgi:hypothetical protein
MNNQGIHKPIPENFDASLLTKLMLDRVYEKDFIPGYYVLLHACNFIAGFSTCIPKRRQMAADGI